MLPPYGTLDEHLAELFDAWWRDVHSEPIPELVGLPDALAILRGDAEGRVSPPTVLHS
ncbi:hypothetical protein ORV05_00015 [Amycolatopsis cynarae]|uniref:Uncharacterized protein n=1 Tax=Amycolatopsis cynarae TaxID=2995223 RepID=A0ABY7B640_9PSEU|nr:hypothetical protein [Amycolatopsis sp. HUAS 11-8]WAL66248.1 hypothetical protein ORV05_00015 [Amycolatopsis sp. HUAS 11-8]